MAQVVRKSEVSEGGTWLSDADECIGDCSPDREDRVGAMFRAFLREQEMYAVNTYAENGPTLYRITNGRPAGRVAVPPGRLAAAAIMGMPVALASNNSFLVGTRSSGNITVFTT